MAIKSNFPKKRYHHDWMAADKNTPETYRLVKILYENERQYTGWWTGVQWDGGMRLPELKVIAWKYIANKELKSGFDK